MSIEQQFTVHNEILLDKKNPRASKEWVKRKLGKNHETGTRTATCPEYSFTAVCSGLPQGLSVGEHFQFDISIQLDSNHTVDDVEDKIYLDYCIFTLIAQTGGCRQSPVELEILRQKTNTQRPSGPFSKDYGYKKTVDIGVLSHVPAIFNGHDANTSFKVRLEMRLNVGNKPGVNNPVDINYDCGLVMHRPVIQSTISRQPARLPTYNEATA